MSQPYPQQPPNPQPYAGGQLVLNLRRPPGLGSGSLITPRVSIDGYPAPAQWGEYVYPVPAGQHRVDVAASYLWTFGQAQLPVVVAPGRSVTVHYSSPMVTFAAGRIGFEPQPRAGAKIFWVLMGIPLLVVLISLIAFVVILVSGS